MDVLATVGSARRNVDMQASLLSADLGAFGCIPRSSVAASHGGFILL